LNGKQADAAGAGIAVRHNCQSKTKEVVAGGIAGEVSQSAWQYKLAVGKVCGEVVGLLDCWD